MIVAAAVCPHPPSLVPEVSPGAAAELDDVRAACLEAVAALLAAHPERVVVIGAGDLEADLDESAGGTLAAYGVGVTAGGTGRELPLSLTIGAWLLDRAGWTGPRTYSTEQPEIVGDVALLVMADGTTRRSVQAPGHLDDRAEPFDAVIAAALATADAATRAALDAVLGDELGATGVPALHTLGHLAQSTLAQTTEAQSTKGTPVSAHLRFDGAPLGVGYVVADWTF